MLKGTTSDVGDESKIKEGSSGRFTNKEIAGKITTHIGTGKNAKDSFVWMTITWSFYIASGISLCFFIRSFFYIAHTENILDLITKIWSIFMPIITLALGYAFGKGK